MKPYDKLSDGERRVRRAWASEVMKRLTDEERTALIEAADNVLDGRARFLNRMRQVAIARRYRKPMKPKGAA